MMKKIGKILRAKSNSKKMTTEKECDCGFPPAECICCGSDCECHENTPNHTENMVISEINEYAGSGPSEKMLKLLKIQEK
jgi:hypothetical protein